MLPLVAAGNVQPKEYLITYVEHEGIIHYYVPLLKKAYEKIGIPTKFVLVNDQRALRLLDQGLTDADTAKSLETITHYPNITYLPTPISKIEVFFICQQHVTCNKSVLSDPNRSLAVIGAKEFYAELLAGSRIKQVELTSFDILYKMFDQQKVDVAIVVLGDYGKPRLNKYPNHYKITEKQGYHLLNQSHKDLIPQLEAAIKEVLAEGDFYQPLDPSVYH